MTGEVTSGGKEKLFSLNHIKTSSQLEEVEGEDIDGDPLESDDEETSAQRPLLVEEDYNIREDSSNEVEDNEGGEIEFEESDDESDEDMELDNEEKSESICTSTCL